MRSEDKKTTPLPPAIEKLRTQGKTTPLPPAIEKLRTQRNIAEGQSPRINGVIEWAPAPQIQSPRINGVIEWASAPQIQGKTKPTASSMQDVASRRAALQNSEALTTPGSQPGAGQGRDVASRRDALLANDPRALALQVLNRQWGNAPERQQRLTEAGFDYQTVQDVVNQYVWNGIPEEDLAQFGRFASAPGAGQAAPGAAGRSVSEYNLTGPPIPQRGGRVASNYNPNKRDVLGNSGLRELYRY